MTVLSSPVLIQRLRIIRFVTYEYGVWMTQHHPRAETWIHMWLDQHLTPYALTRLQRLVTIIISPPFIESSLEQAFTIF